jgi:hypothetical protein
MSAAAELAEIVAESRPIDVHSTKAPSLLEHGFVVVPASDVDPSLPEKLTPIADGLRATMKSPDFPPTMNQLGIVFCGREAEGKEDLSVHTTEGAVRAAAACSKVAITHSHMGSKGYIPMAMAGVPRHTAFGGQKLMWVRQSEEAHLISLAVASEKAIINVLPLPMGSTASNNLRTHWLQGTKIPWREKNTEPLQQMVGNKTFAELWLEATRGKLLRLELERGDIILADPSLIIVPQDANALFLTFSMVPMANPTAACSVLERIHKDPICKPTGLMDTYSGLLKKDKKDVVTQVPLVGRPFDQVQLPEDMTVESYFVSLLYAAFQGKAPGPECNGIWQRLRWTQVTQHTKIKGTHLTEFPDLHKRRTEAVAHVNAMAKKDIWARDLDVAALQRLSDTVAQIAKEMQVVKASPTEQFLNKVRGDITAMRPELTDPAMVAHVEWLEQAVAPDGPEPDYDEIRRRYDLVAKAFNPNYAGNALPPIPSKPKKKQQQQQPPRKEDSKEKRRKKDELLDKIKAPEIFAFILAKKPAPASAQEIECAACSASAIPFSGRFCQGCCNEAVRSMAKEIFPAGLAALKKQPAGLAEEIKAFSAKAKEYRSAQDVDVFGKEVVLASFFDLMDKAAALIRRFQECKIDLPKVVQRMPADALDRDWKEDEEEEDDYDDDDEGEDMISGDDDDDEGEDEDECEEDADDDDDPNLADAKSIIGDGDDPMSASSEEVVILTKKSGRRSVKIATPQDLDDDDDEIVASEESAPDEPVRKKAKPKKKQQAIVVADPYPPDTVVVVNEAGLVADRIIRLKHTLPGAKDVLKSMEKRYATTEKGTPPAIWTAMHYELDKLEKAWSGPRYILELELMNAQGKTVLAYPARLEWNNENAATLGAHNYTEAHPGVKAKVVVKK